MAQGLKCPKCGAHVPPTGTSHSPGGSGPNPIFSARQETTCGECGAELVRNPDDTEHGLDQWRLLEG
jgi:hypothetical protein